jgi:hypothetical protein
MKNILSLLFVTVLFSKFHSQWTYKMVEDEKKEKYKIAYTVSNNNGFAKLENVDNDVVFYLQGDYFCDEEPQVGIIFWVRGKVKTYDFIGDVSDDHTAIFFDWQFQTKKEAYEDFKAARKMEIYVIQKKCKPRKFKFKMKDAKDAIEFIESEK